MDAAPRPRHQLIDWRAVPVFGEPHPSWPRKVRPSAYCIVEDPDGRVAIVRTPEGYSLPGGGSDPGESPEQTAIRETEEECSLLVRLGSWHAAAIEHVTSAREQKHFEKRSIFMNASPIGPGRIAGEPDHELVWSTPADAQSLLTPAAHRWALEQWSSADRASLVIDKSAGQAAIDVARQALDAYARRDWRKVVSFADRRSLKKYADWYLHENTHALTVDELRKDFPKASDEQLASLLKKIGSNAPRFLADIPRHVHGIHSVHELQALSPDELFARILMADDPFIQYAEYERAAYAEVGKNPPERPDPPVWPLTILEAEQLGPNKVVVHFFEDTGAPDPPTDSWLLRRTGNGPWRIVVNGSLRTVGGGMASVIDDPIVAAYLRRLDKKTGTSP